LVTPLPSDGGFAIGCGAVTLLLESRQALQRRGRNPRGTILACSGGLLRADHLIDDAAHVVSGMQSPRHIISSANGTWIDRLEAAAMARGAPGAVVSSIYGYFPETFSVGPLAGIAAAVLGKTLPALQGDVHRLGDRLTAATGAEATDEVGVLCTGFNGTVAGAKISVES